MNRASLRAALLLHGFKRVSKYTYQHQKWLYDPQQQCMYTYVVVYPYWFIGTASIYGVKSFISTKKAWCYINKIVQSYEQ